MSDQIYSRGKAQLMAALDEAVKKVQLEKVVANKTGDVELALNPATLRDMMTAVGVPDLHVAHDGNQNASYQGIPIRESDHIPPGKAFIVDRGAQIRGVTATEIHYDECEFTESIHPAESIASVHSSASALIRGPATVHARELTDEWKNLGTATAEARGAFRDFADAALAVSGRMLPPPEWQDRAVRAAQAAGMDLEWCQQVRVTAGKTDTWARVTTKRGGFDVRPADGESWTQALAAAGIDVPLDAAA